MTDKSNYTEAPIFHSMKCRDCEKMMQGGFRQPDETFLCANCLIKNVEKDSMIWCIDNALEFIENELAIGNRPKKSGLKQARTWLRTAKK